MKALACWLIIVSGAVAQTSAVLDHMPADTRLVVNINFKAVANSPLVKHHGERLRATFGNLPALLANLGVDSNQVVRLWLFIGETYPQGSSLVIVGKIDPAKVEAKMQQWIRERRFAVRPFREDNRNVFALEVPTGLNPVPGMPATVYVAATDEGLVLTSDQKTLVLWLRKSGGTVERFAPLRDTLARDSALTAAFVPPGPLTGKDALLASVTTLTLTIEVTEAITVKCVLHGVENAVLATRVNTGLEQARQVFAPLANQQGIDGKLVAAVVEMLAQANIKSDADSVELAATLDAKTIERLLKR